MRDAPVVTPTCSCCGESEHLRVLPARAGGMLERPDTYVCIRCDAVEKWPSVRGS